MAKKRNQDHMGDLAGQPYKFDKEIDQRIKASKNVVFNIETGQPVVMPGTFKERRNAQIAERKRQGK